MSASVRQEEILAQKDARELERLGYAQELLRGMGGFSNFLAILGVLALLFALHRLTGPHEIRKPLWNAVVETPADSIKPAKTG